MKHYAKRRLAVRAVQWRGEMTIEVRDLIGVRVVCVDAQNQLNLGNGWEVRVGDWIYSSSGEDLAVISDEVFCKIYEEVDETGRALPPEGEHEISARDLVRELDLLLVAGLRLSTDQHPSIFHDRDAIVRGMYRLLEDHSYVVARRERQLIKEQIVKDLS